MTVGGKTTLKASLLVGGSVLFPWNFFPCLIRFEDDSALSLSSPSKIYETESQPVRKTVGDTKA